MAPAAAAMTMPALNLDVNVVMAIPRDRSVSLFRIRAKMLARMRIKPQLPSARQGGR
jgi:hypothetical protein